MHSLIVLWGNWVMRNGTTEITMTKRAADLPNDFDNSSGANPRVMLLKDLL
jgi:hypothetical protein